MAACNAGSDFSGRVKDNKEARDLNDHLDLVIDGLQRNVYNREQIDMLSHALGKLFTASRDVL